MKKKDNKAVERGRIVEMAQRHFLVHGFREVTMDDIARELGMSKKTLYMHFPCKRQLVEVMIDERITQIESDLSAVLAQRDRGFNWRLHTMVETLQHHMEQIRPPFVHSIARAEPALFTKISARRAVFAERTFGKLLSEGRKDGALRTDIPVKNILRIFQMVLSEVLVPAKMAVSGLDLRVVGIQAISLFLEGALARK